MDNEFLILIADRNRHVREFLRRELMIEGYRVQVAKDGREVLMITDGAEPPDLLILDLDVPYISGLTILDRLCENNPLLPVVIHAFLTEDSGSFNVQHAAALVEKSGNTDRLKIAVGEVLQRFYPHRFALGKRKNSLGTENIEDAK
jgi:DNA-binding response OmpR family regulator